MTSDVIASTPLATRPKSIFMLHFDIVGGCQLRCVGCPNSTILPKVKQIDLDSFARCLSHVDVQHVHTFRLFNYGEPLLHENFSGALEIAASQAFTVENFEISTNAQHVYWDDFERALSLGILNRLVVSCDGDATAESYERLRPPGKWHKLLTFLERTREIADRVAPNMELSTRSVIETYQDMENWRQLVHPMGWQTEFRTWKALPEAAENRTGREIEKVGGICTFVAPSERFTMGTFHGELHQLYVDWDGTVVPCCAHPHAGDFGNLNTTLFSDILNGHQRRRFLDEMESNRAKMPICGECEYGPPENPGPSFHDNLPTEEQLPA